MLWKGWWLRLIVNIWKHYGLPKSTHGNSCPSLCAEPKVIYGLFYSWLYIPLCAACVWAVICRLDQNCLGPFCFVSALSITMKIPNHSIHIYFWTKRQTMYFRDHIFAFCCGFVTVDLSNNVNHHSFMFPGKYNLIVYSVSFIELYTPQYIISLLKYGNFLFYRFYLEETTASYNSLAIKWLFKCKIITLKRLSQLIITKYSWQKTNFSSCLESKTNLCFILLLS